MKELPPPLALVITLGLLAALLATFFIVTLSVPFAARERALTGGGTVLITLMAWKTERRRRRAATGNRLQA